MPPLPSVPATLSLRRRRHATLPSDLARRISGYQVLGAVPVSEEGSVWAVAAPDHLLIVPQEGEIQRYAWDEVEHGSWSAEDRAFTLRWTDLEREDLYLSVPGGLRLAEGYQTVDEAPFAKALRQRVEAAIVHCVTGTLPSGQVATASVRRGADGALYSVTCPPHRAAEAGDAAALHRLENQARDCVGLPAE